VNIALLSNFWYQRGGLERVMLDDAAGLTERGHKVAPFASAHPLNEPTPYAQYFSANVDHGALGSDQDMKGRVGTAIRLFKNRSAAHLFDAFADAMQPDVVHQHGLSRQLSADVLERAHARGIPTVLTLHDYSLRCPSGLLSREGAPECLVVSCAGHRYDRAVRFRCVHGSRTASVIAAVELLVARALRRYERAVDVFLVPSEYVAERMREHGLARQDLRVMPNAVEPPGTESPVDGRSVLAFGRLVETKGFDLVVDIARQVPDVSFVVAGDGPERAPLEQRASGLSNVSFVGRVDRAAIDRLLRESIATIVPSEWPEPFGMVVLESWREGRPVIVTRRGALPEIVEHDRTGLVIEPGDVAGAVASVHALVNDPDRAAALGAAGRREVETTYAMATHLDRLEALYRELAA
jgi:glycosyltransferase involved in cell wall biosynthesis